MSRIVLLGDFCFIYPERTDFVGHTDGWMAAAYLKAWTFTRHPAWSGKVVAEIFLEQAEGKSDAAGRLGSLRLES